MVTQLEKAGVTQKDGYGGSEEVKLWRAQQNTRNLYKIITRPYNSPFKLKWTVAQTYAERSQMKKVLKKIDDYTHKRIPIPGSAGEYYTDPYQDPEYINFLINDLLEQWNELSKDLDGASKVAVRDYMEGETKFEYDILNPHFFISYAGEGRLCINTGEKDSGKSDWTCRKGEQYIVEKFKLFGNIEMGTDMPEYEYCSKFTRLIIRICESKLMGRSSVMLLDEAGLDLPSYEGSTRAWKEWDKFMKLTRKFKNNTEFIIQYTSQVPWIFRKNYSAWNHKYSKKVMRYELKAGPHAYKDILIGNIPKTNLPFETEHIAGMDIDIEIRDILSHLDDLPEKANQFEAMMNFVKRRVQKEAVELTAREKRAVALKLVEYKNKNPGKKLTSRSIAEALDIGESTVRKYKKEARDAGLIDGPDEEDDGPSDEDI